MGLHRDLTSSPISRSRLVRPHTSLVCRAPPSWASITSSPLLLWLALASDTVPAGVSDVDAEKRLLDQFVTATYSRAPLPGGRRLRWRARQEDIVWRQLIRMVPGTAIILLPTLLVGTMIPTSS